MSAAVQCVAMGKNRGSSQTNVPGVVGEEEPTVGRPGASGVEQLGVEVANSHTEMETASRVVSRTAPTSRGMAPTVFAPFITEPLCWHYSRKGVCPLGDACRFSHAPSPPPTSSPSTGLLYWFHRMPNNEIEYSLLVNTLHSHGYRRAATPEEERRAALLW